MFDPEGSDHRVRVDVFEGPLDLLLYLIKQNEVDIYDIPISQITDQYLQYMEEMREQDIDRVGEFLVMAATLVRLKLRMLLASQLSHGLEDETDEDELDPRLELVERLLEYRSFRRAAEGFAELERGQRDIYYRETAVHADGALAPQFLEVTFADLLSAFQRVLEYADTKLYHEVTCEELSVEDKIEQIRRHIQQRPCATLRELVGDTVTRTRVVVTFLAILELIRLGEITARQSRLHGEIRIFPASSINHGGKESGAERESDQRHIQ